MWHCIIQPVFSCNFKFTPNNVFIFLFTNHTFLGISCSLSHNSVYISCNSGFFFSEVVLNHFYLLFLFLSQKKRKVISTFYLTFLQLHEFLTFLTFFSLISDEKVRIVTLFLAIPCLYSHNFLSEFCFISQIRLFFSESQVHRSAFIYKFVSKCALFSLNPVYTSQFSFFFFFYTMKWNIKKSFFWIANILSQNYAFIPFYLFIFSSCGRIKLPYKSILNT